MPNDHFSIKRISSRRVKTETGSEPDSASPDEREPHAYDALKDIDQAREDADDTNDQRLKNDKPPHW